jgi:uncharacterized glyoxalase superfamily protein PhnB
MNIPKQYLPVMPYLIVRDARAFMLFMKNVFGATEQILVPRDEKKIMHGELRIGEAVIMFADATEEFNERPAGMFIYIHDMNKNYAAALANGAKSLRPPAKTEYGYTAGFEDPFGNQWWVVEL